MKKLLLSVFAVASFINLNAQCNELFISEYVEGSGNNKALEIYNPTSAAINLTGYRLERFSNGASTSTAGGVLNLSGTIAAHSTFVVVNGQTVAVASPPSPACDTALQAMADQLDGPYPAPCYFNGNDAIVLFNNSTMVDIFGMIGDAAMVSGYGWSDAFPYDGSAGKIWTENHTLIRHADVLQGVTTNPSPEFIVTAQWDSLPEDTWSHLGSHTCNCLTGINEIDNTVSTIIYPNPSNTNYFNISTSKPILNIEVYNMLGELEINEEGNKVDTQMKINTGNLAKGVYLVKATFPDSKITVVKLSIQ
ncbi:MAG: lamin tail domain-containing protein [Bacteroidia bacterium]